MLGEPFALGELGILLLDVAAVGQDQLRDIPGGRCREDGPLNPSLTSFGR